MEESSQSVGGAENPEAKNPSDILSPECNIFQLEEHQPLFKSSDNESFWKENWIDYSKHMDFFCTLAKHGVWFKETEYEAEPAYLGITPEGSNYRASYYIGAAWLAPPKATDAKNDYAIVVTPKMQDIDFIELFLSALKCASATEYFSRFYGINFNEPSIQMDAFDNVLSPLLLIHFVCLLEKLLKRGLKKGFVRREENLNGKIKGRILIAKNIQKNLRTQRQERTYCGYQEWTVDILENRILKKALNFSRQMLKTLHVSEHPKLKEIDQSITRMLLAFEQVGDEIQNAQVRQIKVNKCWREYAEALKVAQMILRRFEYSVEKAGQKQTSVPPFWIDMSRLYEMYVYSKLLEAYGNEIDFQVEGYCKSAVDFIKKDERLIMDTKYKPQYGNSTSGIIDDIRQISGYARDTKILQALGEDKNSSEEIKCLIIFPETYKTDEKESDKACTEKIAFSSEEKLLQKASEIPHFRNFFKLHFPLPKKKGQ